LSKYVRGYDILIKEEYIGGLENSFDFQRMASGYGDLSEIRKDGNYSGHYQKPPKINLLDERPRRESLVEQQLTSVIRRPQIFEQQVIEQIQTTYNPNNNLGRGSQQATQTNIDSDWRTAATQTNTHRVSNQYVGSHGGFQDKNTGQARSNMGQVDDSLIAYSELVRDLSRKEAKLKEELAYMNRHIANPWARPPKVREARKEPGPRASTSQHRWLKECPIEADASSRSVSRASSTRSTTEADLMEKAEQLLKEVEEFEKKPLKTQQVLIESGATKRISSPIDNRERQEKILSA